MTFYFYSHLLLERILNHFFRIYSRDTFYSWEMPPRDILHELHSALPCLSLGPWYMPHTVWSVAPDILGPLSHTTLGIGPWPLVGICADFQVSCLQ